MRTRCETRIGCFLYKAGNKGEDQNQSTSVSFEVEATKACRADSNKKWVGL